MHTQYRVGIIGCGREAKMHLMGWRVLKNVDVVAAADINKEVAENSANSTTYPSRIPIIRR